MTMVNTVATRDITVNGTGAACDTGHDKRDRHLFPSESMRFRQFYQPLDLRKEWTCSKREKLAFGCMRAFERDSLADQIYPCEDSYLVSARMILIKYQ